jgi:TPR repeat protein
VDKNAAEGVELFRKAAEQNYAEAQFNLGVCHVMGENGVKRDPAEGAAFFRKAAERGFPMAQFNLGLCYAMGIGVEQSDSEAVRLYRKAAEHGVAPAQFNLAVCYFMGQGVSRDEVEAYKWILLASSQGFDAARLKISELEGRLSQELIAKGQQSAANFQAAEDPTLHDLANLPESYYGTSDLLAKAEAGDASAQNELGELLFSGKREITRNPMSAAIWFRQAANQNHVTAQRNLGLCYERGEGVPKHEVEAYKWYILAASKGDEKAKDYASMIETILLDSQIKEGRQRADNFKP